MQMIRIGMSRAFQHLRHNHTGKAAGDLLLLLHGIHLDTYGGHGLRDSLGAEVALQIVFKPIVTELHIV